tara:strand:+ start:1154 stop:1660 length:507 start_codon:yes stop_codon:yes gene_type:complete
MTQAEKKQLVLDYLTMHNCSVTKAITDLKGDDGNNICSGNTFYKWKKRDADFAAKIDRLKDRDSVFLDMAEDGLYDKLKSKDWKAIQYVLDTKGKDRGWGKQAEQKIEITHRAIAQIDLDLPKEKWGDATKGSGKMISKCEDDTQRLFSDWMEAKGEEVTIDVESTGE